uniref:Uncharacterized protein n=1 Tax=Oryza rufipogon TaxID=4529 RepID=A0A0E0MYZ9_ORYRU
MKGKMARPISLDVGSSLPLNLRADHLRRLMQQLDKLLQAPARRSQRGRGRCAGIYPSPSLEHGTSEEELWRRCSQRRAVQRCRWQWRRRCGVVLLVWRSQREETRGHGRQCQHHSPCRVRMARQSPEKLIELLHEATEMTSTKIERKRRSDIERNGASHLTLHGASEFFTVLARLEHADGMLDNKYMNREM